MTIDIISYTPEQFASLTQEQLLEVREAQNKKDSWTIALEEKLQKQKEELVKRGIFNSNLFRLIEEKLRAEHEQKVSLLRESVLFYLQYTKPNVNEDMGTPYEVDYALSYEDRFLALRTYYLETYSDVSECFEAFARDEFALGYLGELYATLYTYFKGLANPQNA